MFESKRANMSVFATAAGRRGRLSAMHPGTDGVQLLNNEPPTRRRLECDVDDAALAEIAKTTVL